ncbi:MAG: hypothetical protein M0R33_22305 [Methylomonas sp.]|jgi:hypothetical protein|uniref:hypothetical protein n=1 Tax=Methylomonas sp. TaxID=418 RepID=UPI0026015877|nr:hypothetical protein [Methylomonas sp.]MCK9609177.1 hypothetical protein [Methylomonas sp.]
MRILNVIGISTLPSTTVFSRGFLMPTRITRQKIHPIFSIGGSPNYFQHHNSSFLSPAIINFPMPERHSLSASAIFSPIFISQAPNDFHANPKLPNESSA